MMVTYLLEEISFIGINAYVASVSLKYVDIKNM